MRVISREKLNENWSAVFRCLNKECQAVLEINENDVIVDAYYYDKEFNAWEFNYYYVCPECGKKYELPVDIDSDVMEIINKLCLLKKKK